MQSTHQYAWLIPVLPCLSSAVVGLSLFVVREPTRGQRLLSSGLIITVLSVAMLLSVLTMYQQVSSDSAHCELWPWLAIGALSFHVGYLVDPLSAIMLVLVTTVGVMVMIYASGYMSHDEGYVRFFVYLSLFTASMLALILSPNLIQTYVFWELVGMCSYLLIGFWFTRSSASYASQKAFVTNRIGDLSLLLGIFGVYWLTGSVEFDTISEAMHAMARSDPKQVPLVDVCCLLLFVGPVAKSAQFPLHVWLADAMEGPTPISALIHAATMVAAGVFLTARLLPLFQQSSFVMDSVAWIGAVTALLGATIALAQTDLKRGLAYSTMSQLGYMMLALGMGSYQAGLFHLLTHAYSKALLFLCAGSVIHGMEPVVGYTPTKSQDMSSMGGLRAYMPITGAAFLLGTLSLCGIPPLSCFWSKDEILADAWQKFPVLGWIAWLTAGLTAFYMSRMYLVTFEGSFRGDPSCMSQSKRITERAEREPQRNEPDRDQGHSYKERPAYPRESNAAMVIPLILLAVPTSLIGFIGAPFPNGVAQSDLLSAWLHVSPSVSDNPSHSDWLEFGITASPSVAIAVMGLCLAWAMYGPQAIRLGHTADHIDPIGKGWGGWLMQAVSNWSLNRAYIDRLYDGTVVSLVRLSADTACAVDQWIVDGAVSLGGLLPLLSGESVRYAESGRITAYLFLLVVGLIALLSVLSLSLV